MLAVQLGTPEQNAYGLKMSGAFNTIEDALVWGIDRHMQSRASLKDKMLLLMFDENEEAMLSDLYPESLLADCYAQLTKGANDRTSANRFTLVVYYQQEKGERIGITYNTPLLVSGTELPESERISVVTYPLAA